MDNLTSEVQLAAKVDIEISQHKVPEYSGLNVDGSIEADYLFFFNQSVWTFE